ncbi:hypothetical protein I4U23_015963 [Adineta vaga]|nr:hypothetical protein I4U23_015963 [Adineta vaga]
MSNRPKANLHTLPVELVYCILDHQDTFTIIFSMRNICHQLNLILNSYLQHQTFTILDFSRKRIGNAKARQLADTLRTITTIINMNLSNTGIEAEGIKYITNALQNNTTLRTITFMGTRIGPVGAEYLAGFLQNENTALTALNSNGTMVEDEGARHLANALRNNNVTNLRSGPILIHLNDVDDYAMTKEVVKFFRSKNIPLIQFKGGFSCQYEPHHCRSYWTLSKPADFGYGLGVSRKPPTYDQGYIQLNLNYRMKSTIYRHSQTPSHF